jgi:hypothetical protein
LITIATDDLLGASFLCKRRACLGYVSHLTTNNIIDPSGMLVDPMIALHGAVGCAAADVEVKAWFPDSPSLEFVVGQPITAIIGVRNNGPEGFNVTAVQGNLALVTDPSGNVFNFTGAVRAIF